MNIIKGLPFKKKLSLLVALPLLGIFFFAFVDLRQVYSDKTMVEQISSMVDLSIDASLVVHELQKERGVSTGFIGSGGKAFISQLPNQRRDTDAIVAKVTANMMDKAQLLAKKQPRVANKLNQALSQLNTINQIRGKVDNLSITGAQAARFYTDLNALFLSVSADIANLSTISELTKELTTYYNFMEAKEYAGQERAILNIALNANAFPPGIYKKFVSLQATQEAYLHTFSQFASQEQVERYNQLKQSSASKRVDEIRAISHAKANEGNFGVTGNEWFTQSTERINQLKTLEDNLVQQIQTLISKQTKQTSKAMWTSLSITALLIAITVLLIVYVSKILISQTNELARAINVVADKKDLSVKANVVCSDELGQSAQSFNSMLDIVANTLKEIESSSHQLSEAAEETNQAVGENAKSLEQQTLETTQAATATEQMTATVNEIAQSTTLTADSANQAAILSADGVSQIEDNVEKMNTLNDQMTTANQQVQQLRDASQEINSIVDVIKAVAEQTNLLALNAAIEAARAGEHGRGFAVVADEVRTLAQRTQESTARIEEMVLRFQSDANDVSKSIESSFEHVKSSVDQTLSVKGKLSEINTSISSITDMCHQIATAAEEQVAATGEIAENIRSINDLAGMCAQAGSEMSSNAQEQSKLSVRQHELIGQFTIG